MEIEILGHSYGSLFLFPFPSPLLAVHRLVQKKKRSAIFTRFRWKLLKHICTESSRRLTVCTSTSQSQKSPDSGLSHLIAAVSQRLVAFCMPEVPPFPCLLHSFVSLGLLSDPLKLKLFVTNFHMLKKFRIKISVIIFLVLSNLQNSMNSIFLSLDI